MWPHHLLACGGLGGGCFQSVVKTAWKVTVIYHSYSREVSYTECTRTPTLVSQAVGMCLGRQWSPGGHPGLTRGMVYREQPPETWPSSALWSKWCWGLNGRTKRQQVDLGHCPPVFHRGDWGRGQACKLLSRNITSFVLYGVSLGDSVNGKHYASTKQSVVVWFSFEFPHTLKSNRLWWCSCWFLQS